MNFSPLAAGKRLRAAALALTLSSAAGAAFAETLHEAFERAWVSFPAGRTLEAGREEVAASHRVAEALFPGAPKIGLSQRSDRWNEHRGTLENEIEISLPLWLPGQQAARQRVAAADGEENRGAIEAARLALAGELRTALWNLQLARGEAEIAVGRRETAAGLEADVARRVEAGEIARTDLLLARQESAAARIAAAEARSRVVRAGQRYRVLTGSESPPDSPEESASPAAAPGHPRLAAAQAALERARAALLLARESRRDAPSLAVQYRREQDRTGAAPADSIRFGISIPLASESRNAPLIAGANTALIRAEAEYRRLQAEVEAGEREAEAQLEAASAGAESAGEGEQAAAERLRLLRRSFALGETALVELLRAQSQAGEARLELARSRVRLFAARANLNQARGITP